VSRKVVIKFIIDFRSYEYGYPHSILEDVFLSGYCYYFALILQSRFGGEILYDPVEGHFVTAIYDTYHNEYRLYDIRGEVTDKYKYKELYSQQVWSTIPSIVKGCILKESDYAI